MLYEVITPRPLDVHEQAIRQRSRVSGQDDGIVGLAAGDARRRGRRNRGVVDVGGAERGRTAGARPEREEEDRRKRGRPHVSYNFV